MGQVASFASDDGLAWHYTATVAQYDPRRVYQEGANENDLVLLKDSRTLFAVMRTVRQHVSTRVAKSGLRERTSIIVADRTPATGSRRTARCPS